MLFCARVDGGALDGPSSPRDGATWRSRASLFCHFPGARVLAPGARGPRPSARSRVLSPSPLAPVGSCLPLFLGALQTWPVLARWVLLPLLSFGVVPLRRGRPCGGCGSSPRERRAVGRSLNRAGVGPARFSCVFFRTRSGTHGLRGAYIFGRWRSVRSVQGYSPKRVIVLCGRPPRGRFLWRTLDLFKCTCAPSLLVPPHRLRAGWLRLGSTGWPCGGVRGAEGCRLALSGTLTRCGRQSLGLPRRLAPGPRDPSPLGFFPCIFLLSSGLERSMYIALTMVGNTPPSAAEAYRRHGCCPVGSLLAAARLCLFLWRDFGFAVRGGDALPCAAAALLERQPHPCPAGCGAGSVWGAGVILPGCVLSDGDRPTAPQLRA